MSDAWSLLSISDIHFTSDSKLDDAKQLQYSALTDDIFPNFQNILKGFPQLPLDLVAIVGDITTRGNAEGFQRFAADTLPPLRSLVTSEAAICIVPGNHDVVWGLDAEIPNSFNKKFEAFKLVADTDYTCCLFPDGRLTKNANRQLTFLPGNNGPIFVDRKRKLIALCINSSIRCGEFNKSMSDDFAVYLKDQLAKNNIPQTAASWMSCDSWKALHNKYFIRDVAHITQSQRNQLRDRLEDLQKELGEDWHSYLRVAIVHHHLVHFPGQIVEHKDYEFLVDSADMVSLLVKYDFDVALTGHKHQPYAVKHLEDGKELLLVGGPTVGGHAAGDAFRGVRCIQVEDRGGSRTFNIRDIPYTLGAASVADEWDKCKTYQETCSISAQSKVKRRYKKEGFAYQGIVSITEITPDGDAVRVIECDGFHAHNKNILRTRSHAILLPSTSGYITNLEAAGKDTKIHIPDDIPHGSQVHEWKTVLTFSPPIGIGRRDDYYFKWQAINSFALDNRQYSYMYGAPSAFQGVEFTHIAIEDPVEELTVIVRFPSSFSLNTASPRIRVAIKDTSEVDAKKWEIDWDTERQLKESHAFWYNRHLREATLRVSNPSPTLSYGIEWDVPDARVPAEDAAEQGTIRGIFQRVASSLKKNQIAAVAATLVQIIHATRSTFTEGWSGPIEASLWLFDGKNKLTSPVAVVEDGDEVTNAFRRKIFLQYGMGIAGRAFKTNRPRVYVYVPPEDAQKDEPDYYIPLEGTPAHKVLVALPIHLPVSKQVFTRHPSIYESKVPYGVLCLGSEFAECPLAQLRLPEEIKKLIVFQHSMSMCFRAIKESILEV